MTRLLVVTHYFPEHGGGVEIAAHHIATGLVRRGLNVEWIASHEPALPPTSAPGARPVPALNFIEHRTGVPYPLWGLSGLRAIEQGLRRSDILHLHDTLYFGNCAAFLAARRLGKPVLITQHVGHVPYRNPILSGTMSLANRAVSVPMLVRAAGIAFYSKTTERYFRELAANDLRAVWIPNGLDLQLYRPLAPSERRDLRAEFRWPDGRPVFLFVGRFVEKKGLRTLASLVKSFPEVTWVFAGWGPADPARWAAKNVLVVGRCSAQQVARLYQAADLLVLPSVGEGFPLVVQESMACGTPVAVSREVADAHPELHPHVWAASPTIEGFTALLRPLSTDPSLLQERRSASAVFAAREWNWETCVSEYHELISAVLQRHAVGR